MAGVAVDPLTSHECGNQRYLAIPWFNASLQARLPKRNGSPLRPMPEKTAWLAPLNVTNSCAATPKPAAEFSGLREQSVWLPNAAIARAWSEYVKDTAVSDKTPPPAPVNLRVSGNQLTWEARADLESGLAAFIIVRDGRQIATVPKEAKNPFGRPVFQGCQYSDTPSLPLARMRFTDTTAEPRMTKHHYRVIAVNTVGLKSR